MRWIYALLLLSVCTDARAGAAPAGLLMAGTIVDASASKVETGGGYATCALSSQLIGGQLIDQGRALSLWRQDAPGGPIVVTIPSIGRAVTTASGVTGWSYYSAGAGILKFTTATSGTLSFPAPGNWVTGTGMAPVFSNYGSYYNAGSGSLTIQFTLTIGDCSVPFAATYQG